METKYSRYKEYYAKYREKEKERRKQYVKLHKEELKEKRQRKRYWEHFDLINKFNTSIKGYLPQYETKPETINENRVFTKEDFEYIKSMSNKQYPSLEDNKQTSLQKYNIKVKYENL